MKVGVFTALLSQLPLKDVLKKLRAFQIDTVELGTGNYPGDSHCKLSLLEDSSALSEFKNTLAGEGVSISALSCHGNALHPNADVAQRAWEVSRKTILLAEKLGVPFVVDFSGCPGDSPSSTAPNWVTCPWPPDYRDVLEWQWNEVVAPYWTEHAAFASQHGVKIAVEMHPGFVVYSPETMLRLRSLTGSTVGCNYDPIGSLARPSTTFTPRIRSSTPPIFLGREYSTQSPTPMKRIAHGYFVPAVTVMVRSGGKNLFQRSEWLATITSFPSNMKTACFLLKRG
jgi:sugar phosphate isomerase/epimerase